MLQGQSKHHVMEYHEPSYLVSLLFAALFTIYIFFSTCLYIAVQPNTVY